MDYKEYLMSLYKDHEIEVLAYESYSLENAQEFLRLTAPQAD